MHRSHDSEGGHADLSPTDPGQFGFIQDALKQVQAIDTEEPIPQIANYRLIGRIHEGGQGVVYRAIQEGSGRSVAIKILHSGRFATRRRKLRFEREIELAASLRHPNIASIVDSGVTPDGLQFLAMPFIEGVTLGTYVRSLRNSGSTSDVLRRLLALFAKLCDAVDHAHKNGIMHRDLKPANILIDTKGEPHILDFGLAKFLLEESVTEVTSLTGSGGFIGTLPYASPEQAQGEPGQVDLLTDVYSLGVMLYEAIAGIHPYPVSGETAQVMRNIAEKEPGRLTMSGKRVAADVETVVRMALTKDKHRRYQSAAALAADLRRLLAGDAIEARRDSYGYLFKKACRALAIRHPIVCYAATFLASATLAHFAGAPLMNQSTATRQFERISRAFTATAAEAPMPHVAIIGFTKATDLESLAEQEGLRDVNPLHLESLRRLHGRFMEHLVQASPRAVIWDISFEGDTPFDDDFAAGADALTAAGIDVVVGVRTWWLDQKRRPAVSRRIAEATELGCLTTRFGANATWMIEAAARRGVKEPIASLALQAVAAYHEPGAELFIHMDREAAAVELMHWDPDPEMPQVKRWREASHLIQLTTVWDEPNYDDPFGLRPGDLVGNYFVDMPSQSVLDGSTFEYGQVLQSDPTELRGWFEDKVLVIGDMRPGIDRFGHPDGRSIPGCHGHAVAINSILGQSLITSPNSEEELLLLFAGVMAGLGISFASLGRLRRRSMLVITSVVFMAIAIFSYHNFDILCYPLVPIIGMVAACELSSVVRRMRTPQL